MVDYGRFVAWGTAAGAAKTLTTSYAASLFAIIDPVTGTTYAAGVIPCLGYRWLNLHALLSADPTSVSMIVQTSEDETPPTTDAGWDTATDASGAYDVRSIPLNASRPIAAGGSRHAFEVTGARWARVLVIAPGAVAETAIITGMLVA